MHYIYHDINILKCKILAIWIYEFSFYVCVYAAQKFRCNSIIQFRGCWTAGAVVLGKHMYYILYTYGYTQGLSVTFLSLHTKQTTTIFDSFHSDLKCYLTRLNDNSFWIELNFMYLNDRPEKDIFRCYARCVFGYTFWNSCGEFDRLHLFFRDKFVLKAIWLM